jgi:hypothetical protein
VVFPQSSAVQPEPRVLWCEEPPRGMDEARSRMRELMAGAPVTFHTGFDRWMTAAIAVAVGPGAVIGWLVPKARVIQLLLAAYFVLAIWYLYRNTYYTFGELCLHLRFGPLHADVPYSNIRSAVPGHRADAGYAFSMRRLVIELGEGDRILISPADRDGFLDELHRRAPQAIIQHEAPAGVSDPIRHK